MSKLEDLTGQTFGYLTVLEKSGRRQGTSGYLWRCLCVCGNETLASAHHMKIGQTKSCGCKRYKTGVNPGERYSREDVTILCPPQSHRQRKALCPP